MELTCNQKILLLVFIVAIISVIFMEYTREYIEPVPSQQGQTVQTQLAQPSATDVVHSAATQLLNKAFGK
jgi:hypothetical protein